MVLPDSIFAAPRQNRQQEEFCLDQAQPDAEAAAGGQPAGHPRTLLPAGDQARLSPGQPHARVVGFTDLDSRGIAGVERPSTICSGGHRALQLSIDVRIQHILHEEVSRAMPTNAIGGAGVVMDVKTGEILAMVSLPDFEPSQAGEAAPDARFNRTTLGVFEIHLQDLQHGDRSRQRHCHAGGRL